MKILHLLLLLLFCPGLFAQEQKIYLDPKSAISTSISQLFTKVEFIPLETKRESTFSSPTNLVVTDKYYIIMDGSLSSVFFFNKEGTFISVFKNKGYDLLTMKYVREKDKIYLQTKKQGFALTPKQEYEKIQNDDDNYYQVWVCDLKVTDNLIFKPLNHFSYGGYSLYPLNDGGFLASAILSGKDFPDTNAYELKYIFDGRVNEKFFSYNQHEFTPYYDKIRNVSFFNTSSDTEVLFTRPFRYEIYSFKKGKVSSKYQLVFPAQQSLPSDFFSRDLSTETNWEIMRKENQGAVDNILPQFAWSNYMVFWLYTLQPNNMRDWRQYLLELNTQTLIRARLIKADSISYDLPINFVWLRGQDDQSVYTFMTAAELLELTKGKNETYPPGLRAFLKKPNAGANMVIVRLFKR